MQIKSITDCPHHAPIFYQSTLYQAKFYKYKYHQPFFLSTVHFIKWNTQSVTYRQKRNCFGLLLHWPSMKIVYFTIINIHGNKILLWRCCCWRKNSCTTWTCSCMRKTSFCTTERMTCQTWSGLTLLVLNMRYIIYYREDEMPDMVRIDILYLKHEVNNSLWRGWHARHCQNWHSLSQAWGK